MSQDTLETLRHAEEGQADGGGPHQRGRGPSANIAQYGSIPLAASDRIVNNNKTMELDELLEGQPVKQAKRGAKPAAPEKIMIQEGYQCGMDTSEARAGVIKTHGEG